MKLHKISLYISDLNNDFELEDIKDEIENSLDNFVVWIGKCETKKIGRWQHLRKS